MKNKAYLKQSAAEKYDIKEASNQNNSAKTRQDYARNAQYDNKNFAQKIDGDMGSFDVMSEPAPVMSRSANKVNHIAAGRSKFMQADKKPKEFKIDRQATNAANMEIAKDNEAIRTKNTEAKANVITANNAIDVENKKTIIETDAYNKDQAEAAKRFRRQQQLSSFRQDQNPDKGKKVKKGKKNKSNPFSGFPGDRKNKKKGK